MTIKLQPWHAGIAALVLALALFVHSSVRPYTNNQWKPHRWMTEDCVAHGNPKESCGGLAMQSKNSPEMAYFDICLEHGEFKRIK